MSYAKTVFGTTKHGEETWLYTFTNQAGMQMKVTDYGAILQGIIVKDKDGKEVDVVLGYDDAKGYEEGTVFLGAVVGRSANRIGGASFELNGKTYELCKNDHGNNLHSGLDFYHNRIWKVEKAEENSITFSLFSPNMDQGYPGEVTIYTTYTLTEDNEIQIAYEACPSEDTILNLTNHSYFNLDGHGSGSVLTQKVWINADVYTRNDAQSIPTGEFVNVEGTPMDFRVPKVIGKDIDADHEAIRFGQGYDLNYMVNGEGYRKVAGMVSEKTGIQMEVYTDLPGIQLYSGNFLAGEKGKAGAVYPRRSAACFETQYVPDAIHHDNFEGPVCKKGDTYRTKTAYRFHVYPFGHPVT